MPHALLVDDNAGTLDALSQLVRGEGFTASAASTIEAARAELGKQRPDVVVIDLKLPDGNGMTLLDALDQTAPPAVLLITGHASIDTAVEALRRGVTDYLTKPLDVGRLRQILGDIAKTSSLPTEIHNLRIKHAESGRFGKIIGHSAAIQGVCDLIGRIAPSSASVLISGESGSGKDLVAETIHELSRRRHGPYVPVNCGAISPTLIESELFGHERGSFTGADRRHKGHFERASRGTLFLDEITEMPIELQAKLLRVLESGSFTRVGGEEPLSVDVRIIAASNRNVQEAVEQGKLREDLYYRLKVFQLCVPPLRERPDDVLPLAQWFLDEVKKSEGSHKRFAMAALERMNGYAWPGNVRELRNVVHSAYILAADIIDVDHLPSEFHSTIAPPVDTQNMISVKVGTPIAEVERRLILATLQHCDSNKAKTAETLGISLKTLYNRLGAYRSGNTGESRDGGSAACDTDQTRFIESGSAQNAESAKVQSRSGTTLPASARSGSA
jgi:DNA-binding NtrC family response regulator